MFNINITQKKKSATLLLHSIRSPQNVLPKVAGIFIPFRLESQYHLINLTIHHML